MLRDRNGSALDTASTLAALLHGRGDFVESLVTRNRKAVSRPGDLGHTHKG